MKSRIVFYLAILVIWNAFLDSKSVWSETGTEKTSFNSLPEKDKKILEIGEIGDVRHVMGGVIGTYPGFGLGHAIQGRYSSKGWIFTVGEGVSLGMFMFAIMPIGFGEDDDVWTVSAMIGFAGFLTFKIWEIIDVWVAPLEHNRRYNQIKKNLGQSSGEDISLFIYPKGKDSIAMGLQIQF